MRHVVTRTVRDSAAVLDVLQGYMTGDWYTAPPPARAYTEEVGAPPPKLRIGVRTTAPLGLATVDPECIAAVDTAARVLESLGHTVVVDAAPLALDDGALLETFTAVMLSSLRAEMGNVEEVIGRPVTAADMELLLQDLEELDKLFICDSCDKPTWEVDDASSPHCQCPCGKLSYA